MKSITNFIKENRLPEWVKIVESWFYDYGPAAEEILDMEWNNNIDEQKVFMQKLAIKEIDSLYDILNIVEDFESQYDIDSNVTIKYENQIIDQLSILASNWLKENM